MVTFLEYRAAEYPVWLRLPFKLPAEEVIKAN